GIKGISHQALLKQTNPKTFYGPLENKWGFSENKKLDGLNISITPDKLEKILENYKYTDD
ncbi:MAG: hypothetical protein O2985_16750, partial [Proteobacteria bacterium]|nr:hypothetical protein [Pseudomonadota bacterium]